jgi:RPA family protein
MEGTARVFAGEYCSSTLSVQDDDPGNPAWVVTIGGAWCRFMFLSGALTEVTECGDMVYTRIADPTGVFDLVIGGRNTALAETFCKLPVPSFVTVTGRAQMYLKKGVVVLSVRPDNVVVVKRRVRDQWVLATAKSTLERLQRMNIALQGTCADERILAAVRHYSITGTGPDGRGCSPDRSSPRTRCPRTAGHPYAGDGAHNSGKRAAGDCRRRDN